LGAWAPPAPPEPATQTDYRWRLDHLTDYYGDPRIDAITFDTVEHYIAAKLGDEDPRAARSINIAVTLLATVLEVPSSVWGVRARPGSRSEPPRARVRPRRTYLHSASQIEALLGAARELDCEAQEPTYAGRRRVEVRGALRAELSAVRSRVGGQRESYVFETCPSSSG
jgi:hypothetical protein